MTTGHFRIIGRHGDVGFDWDVNDPASVQAAQDKFDYFITERRGRAFRIAEENDMLTTFDPTAEEIILIPQIAGGC